MNGEEITPDVRLSDLQPKPNITIGFGGGDDGVCICMREKHTITKRLQWWLFCKVFPCRIVEWRDE